MEPLISQWLLPDCSHTKLSRLPGYQRQRLGLHQDAWRSILRRQWQDSDLHRLLDNVVVRVVFRYKHQFQVINTKLFTEYRMHLQRCSSRRRIIEGARHVCSCIQLGVIQRSALHDAKRIKPGDHRRGLGYVNRDTPLRHIVLIRVLGGEGHLQGLPIARVQNSSCNWRILERPWNIGDSVQL